jgi:hypothetical protein
MLSLLLFRSASSCFNFSIRCLLRALMSLHDEACSCGDNVSQLDILRVVPSVLIIMGPKDIVYKNLL